jgi:glucose-6-phosphate 1-dehydrogenase
VLRSLRAITPEEAERVTVRGQYVAGAVEGQPAKAYEEERGQPSDTETFVAIRADIDNWRWAGVPFFMRTGIQAGAPLHLRPRRARGHLRQPPGH